MLILWVHTTLETHAGRPIQMPIGVPDENIAAFGERLSREGGVLVVQLRLDRRPDGYAYIVDEVPLFLGLACIGTVRDYDHPVRREVDEVTE